MRRQVGQVGERLGLRRWSRGYWPPERPTRYGMESRASAQVRNLKFVSPRRAGPSGLGSLARATQQARCFKLCTAGAGRGSNPWVEPAPAPCRSRVCRLRARTDRSSGRTLQAGPEPDTRLCRHQAPPGWPGSGSRSAFPAQGCTVTGPEPVGGRPAPGVGAGPAVQCETDRTRAGGPRLRPKPPAVCRWEPGPSMSNPI